MQATEATWHASVPYLNAFVAGPVEQITRLQSTTAMSPCIPADKRFSIL